MIRGLPNKRVESLPSVVRIIRAWASKPLPALPGAGIFVVIGLCQFVGGWMWRDHTSAFLASAAHAEGKVVAISRSRKGGSHPVFVFEDKSGQTHRVRSREDSIRFEVGDVVRVSYDPIDPNRAALTDVTSSYAGPFVVMAVGVLFMGVAARSGYKQYRWDRARIRMPANGMMDETFLFEPLNALVAKYRPLSFRYWSARFTAGEELHDYAQGDEGSLQWWQAHTNVLEVEEDGDGRQYALVAVTIFPNGLHSSPPAPSAGFKVYEDGIVAGTWADGSKFSWRQQRAGRLDRADVIT